MSFDNLCTIKTVEWRITNATYSHIMDIISKHGYGYEMDAAEELRTTFALDRNIEYRIVVGSGREFVDWPNPKKKVA